MEQPVEEPVGGPGHASPPDALDRAAVPAGPAVFPDRAGWILAALTRRGHVRVFRLDARGSLQATLPTHLPPRRDYAQIAFWHAPGHAPVLVASRADVLVLQELQATGPQELDSPSSS